MSDKTGGPAFPVHETANINEQEGMTLRDYFAAKAMAAILSNPHADTGFGAMCMVGEEMISKWAYQQADAMLEARNG